MRKQRTRTVRRPAHVARSSAPSLDPYAVQGTMTLEEWRRTVAPAKPVHIVRYDDHDPVAA
ncbi:MAG TPA: hypothetical protein VM262_12370 [Acidimicrobiales bacterium]|nr:hypothetical protein [Acidimicrobiales bacterium]